MALTLCVVAALMTLGSADVPLKVPVGHLLSASRPAEAFDVIFELALFDARKAGILANDSVLFELHQIVSCGHTTAPAAAFELVTVHNVSAILGPVCSTGAVAIGKFAAWAWDIPLMSYSTRDPSLGDKAVYKTLVRLSAPVTEFAKATIQLLQLYNWTTVGVVIDSGTWPGRYYWNELQPELHRHAINVSIFFDIAGNLSLLTTGIMENLKKNSRILLVCVSKTSLGANYFMKQAYSAGMTGADYVYIIPDLDRNYYQQLPWHDEPENYQPLLAIYQQTFLIVASGADDDAADVFFGRLLPILFDRHNLTLADLYHSSRPFYLLFYDLVTLYIRAVTACLNVADCRWNSGVNVIEQMLKQTFNGATGNVLLQSNFDRSQPFYVMGLQPGDRNILHYYSFNVNANKRGDGSSWEEYVITEMQRKIWLTANGKPPLAKPSCGFDNEYCQPNYFMLYVTLIIGASLLAILVAILIYRTKKRAVEEQILAMSWIINRHELVVANNVPFSLQSMSLTSISGQLREVLKPHRIPEGAGPEELENEALTMHSGEYFGTAALRGAQVAMKRCLCTDRLPLQQNRRTLLKLKQLTDTGHENVNSFAGICLNSNNVLTIVWNYCQKGSLEDILYNDEIKLDAAFQSSILKDIVRGLDYIHHSPIGVHGRLSAANCLVDSRWVVKLTDFGLQQILNEFIQNNSLHWKPETLQSISHVAPEVCCSYNDRGPTVLPTQASDAYSFGIVMFQVLFRLSPYDHIIISPSELIAELKKPNTAMRPAIPTKTRKDHHADLVNMISSCWSHNPDDRPRLARIKNVVNATMAAFSNNLVDHMVGMMERYAKNLEQMVQSRTTQLQEERKRSDNLLNRMLPRSVAEKLKLGLSVEAESFDAVTIFFSDIVGFTQLCGMSSPMQIVNMLNQLYSVLDEVIEECDAYKVETVGDAYLVVSGLPVRNGNRHVVEIATMSLRIIEGIKNYRITHLPKERVEMRIGIHTGAAAAGVIGIAMPHYCIFGDTVNIASRMEQTSMPMRIQITAQARDALISAAADRFEIVLRGSVEIKGKGLCETFWLNGYAKQKTAQPPQPMKTMFRDSKTINVSPASSVNFKP